MWRRTPATNSLSSPLIHQEHLQLLPLEEPWLLQSAFRSIPQKTSTSPSGNTMNPSESSSEHPLAVPSLIHSNLPSLVLATNCADLHKFNCKKNTEECILISKPNKIGLCTTKKSRFEHDCSKCTDQTTCTNKSKGSYTFTNEKCTHLCNAEKKKGMHQLNAKKKKPCKYIFSGNPCLGCYPLPIC